MYLNTNTNIQIDTIKQKYDFKRTSAQFCKVQGNHRVLWFVCKGNCFVTVFKAYHKEIKVFLDLHSISGGWGPCCHICVKKSIQQDI